MDPPRHRNGRSTGPGTSLLNGVFSIVAGLVIGIIAFTTGAGADWQWVDDVPISRRGSTVGVPLSAVVGFGFLVATGFIGYGCACLWKWMRENGTL